MKHQCIIILIDPQLPKAAIIKQQLNLPIQLCMDRTLSDTDIFVSHLQIPQMETQISICYF